MLKFEMVHLKCFKINIISFYSIYFHFSYFNLYPFWALHMRVWRSSLPLQIMTRSHCTGSGLGAGLGMGLATIGYAELFTYQDQEQDQIRCLLLCQSRSLCLSRSHSHALWTYHKTHFVQSYMIHCFGGRSQCAKNRLEITVIGRRIITV